MAKNWYSILIAYWKMLNIDFIKNYVSSRMGGGEGGTWGYAVLVPLIIISTLIITFSAKYRRNRLVLECFIELPV